MMANYLLDIVILLTAALVAVPLCRAAGFGAVPGFLVAGVLVGPSGLTLIDNVTEIETLILRFRDDHYAHVEDKKPE